MHRRKAVKSARLYTVILFLWAALMIPLVTATRPLAAAAFHRSPIIGVLMVITMLFISYFWLNGLKDLVYPIAYRIRLARGLYVPRPRCVEGRLLSVGLLYCTCNDFNAESLLASMQQEYPGCFTVILDDSSDPEMIAAVNEFSTTYGVKVSRRPNREGFKAGNLNWFLQKNDMDYFVILDSDEIIPPGFVSRCLDYFAANPAIGIVQANHIATRNRTTFMRTFAPGVDSHWPAYQAVKAFSGFMSLLGHGAMVDIACYDDAGGFPPLVAEDICFAIEARNAGWLTVFAPDITCEEEFPVDYAAFKKRHRKWTEGNMEFIRKYSWKILSGRMRWFEKLDIVLFTYSLPLTGIFSIYVITNAIIFPLVGFRYHYPIWMLIPTGLFLVAPLINDIFTYIRQPKGQLLSYLLHSVVLFGSMYFVSLHASIKSAVGQSIFHVTPKTVGRGGLWPALRQNTREIIFAVVLSAAVAAAAGSVLPVVLLVIPICFSVYLAVMNTGDSLMSHRNDSHQLASGKNSDDPVLLKEAISYAEPEEAVQWNGIGALQAIAVTDVMPALDWWDADSDLSHLRHASRTRTYAAANTSSAIPSTSAMAKNASTPDLAYGSAHHRAAGCGPVKPGPVPESSSSMHDHRMPALHFTYKPERCPYGHSLAPGMPQKISWMPCSCDPAREAAEPSRGMGHVTLWCGACSAENHRVTRFYEPPHVDGRDISSRSTGFALLARGQR